MRQQLLLLGLAAPLLLGAARDKEGAGWKEFTSKDGGFVVRMPGVPMEQKESLRTPSGPVDLVMYVVERKQEETAYLVLYCELSAAAVQKGTDQQRLDYARKRAVAATRGKLVGEKKITLGDYPGRELRYEIEGKGLIRQRLFVVKNNVYQLLVAGPREQVLSKDADRFLDSFKLKP